jgi:hypothetical protein
VGLGEVTAEGFAGGANGHRGLELGLHLPVASSSMARRVFSGIRRVLSMGPTGGPPGGK